MEFSVKYPASLLEKFSRKEIEDFVKLQLDKAIEKTVDKIVEETEREILYGKSPIEEALGILKFSTMIKKIK